MEIGVELLYVIVERAREVENRVHNDRFAEVDFVQEAIVKAEAVSVGVAGQFQYLGSGGVPPSGVDIDNGVANSVVFVHKNIFRHTLGIGDYITGRSASRVVGICLPHAKPRNGNGIIGIFTLDITLYIIGIANSSADLEHVRVGPESVEIVPASVIPIRIVVPGQSAAWAGDSIVGLGIDTKPQDQNEQCKGERFFHGCCCI